MTEQDLIHKIEWVNKRCSLKGEPLTQIQIELLMFVFADTVNKNFALAGVSGSTDKFGTIMTCLPKYSNCQLCKYKEEPQDSDVCTYCAKHNKSTEYYR